MKCISPLNRLFGLVLLLATVPAWAVVVDFEIVADLTPVGSTYPGVTFTNASAVKAGFSLNEFEFPPVSGTTVAFDDGGPISGVFSTPVTSLGFYATYVTPLTFSIYNAAAVQVGQLTSQFSDNTTSSGNPPNELMQLTHLAGISSFKIEGEPLGNSFVIDDFTFTSGTTPQPVPDENAVPALGLALLLASLMAAGRRFGRC